MTDEDAARAAALNPWTGGDALAAIAAARPDLGALVAAHPNAYDGLLDWLAEYGDAAARQAVAARRRAASVPPPPPMPVAATIPPAPTAERSPEPPRPVGPIAGVPATGSVEPTSGEPPWAIAPHPEPSPKPFWRRRWVIGTAIGVVVLLVAGGAGTWWFVSSRFGGASTPTAAAERLASSVENVDPVALYGALAPSEISELQPSFEKIAASHPQKDGVDVAKLLDGIHKAITVTPANMTFRTETIADGVERVTWTKGSVKISGDEKALANALFAAEEPLMRDSLKASGRSPSDIDQQVADSRSSFVGSVRLPQTIDSKNYNPELSVVAVQEGGGWYISPLMTIADAWARSVQRNEGRNVPALGDHVVDARQFSTPQDAAKALADAIVHHDTYAMAQDLSLPERRLVSIYGPVWTRATDQGSSSSPAPTLSGVQFSATTNGDTASLRIDNATLTTARFDSDVSQNLTTTTTLHGVCANWDGQSAYDNGYTDDYGNYQDNWQVQNTSGQYCLTDYRPLEKLGAADLTIQAVKENGGWLVSPIATIANAVSIVTDHYMKLQDSGQLADLFRQN